MFWKILLCLVLLVGCTATPKDDIDTQNPVVDIEDPVDDKIEEPVVTFDWVIRKQYNNSIGKLGSKYRYYPFEFETDGDSFKFNYKGPGDTEEYVILGNWNEEKVYFEFPKVEFTIKEQYVLTQLAEVENGIVYSYCSLEDSNGNSYSLYIDQNEGDLVIEPHVDLSNEVWFKCYNAIRDFYEIILAQDMITADMRLQFEKIKEGMNKDLIPYTYNNAPERVPIKNSQEVWDRMSLSYFKEFAIDYNSESNSPWNLNMYENPQMDVILSNINDIKNIENVSLEDEFKSLDITLYQADHGFPMLHITEYDGKFIIDCQYGQATFESEELKVYIAEVFDEEKATKEYLANIDPNSFVKAYICTDDTEDYVEIQDLEWIAETIRLLSECEYVEPLTPEIEFPPLIAHIIFRDGDQLKSLTMHQTTTNYSWVRLEGKFTEYNCIDVLNRMKEKVAPTQTNEA
ncbi:MAG: hypothetical protein E7191_00380 [Erysipelotrichaceae bacterium]|nr:hypothetical protein [Erysipelotrichaceae bacterium]